jgi:tetratricopeptide (TPR) repeat protein
MKKLITFLSICTTVAILALPVAARNSIAPQDKAVQDPCSVEGKDALYQSFLKNRPNDQPKAFEDAKKYLGCPAGEVTEAQQKIIDYLKKWTTAYEEGSKKIRFRTLLYNDKKYQEAYALGKELLTAEPENLKVLVDLGANGYLVAPLKNPALNTEALDYAKRALQMLDSGKTIDDWAPLASKDVAVAYLNYTVGSLTLEADPSTALKHLLKAAQFETPLKKSPFTYAYIAGAYETGPYAKQSEQYKTVYSGKDETPESKLALANINQLVDRMIDGYARAVALAGSDTNYSAQKPVWNDSLIQWYKFRNNNTDTGLTELIAGILAKPLPPEPTPLTSLPASTPAASPVGNSVNGNGAATSTTGTGTTAPGTKPATPAPATPAPATKPNTTKPDRPRNR